MRNSIEKTIILHGAVLFCEKCERNEELKMKNEELPCGILLRLLYAELLSVKKMQKPEEGANAIRRAH